jgi:hypothetical protein
LIEHAPIVRSTTRVHRALAASLAAAALLTAAACGGDSKAKKSSSVPPSASGNSSSSSSSAGPKPAAAKNPFTGIGGVPNSPTISVKIDDTAPGRPQLGIDKADIVYVEAVEGGLTRLAAIFGSQKPNVGYVRSTRPSDPDLLLQFGKITAAYSGGAHDSLPLIRHSGLKSWSNDAGAPYFYRVSRASAYINVVLNLSKVAKAVHTPRPKSIGWTFRASDAGLPAGPGTDVRTTVTGSYSTGTRVEFRYSYALKAYVRYIDGVRQVAADGRPVTAKNVIVQSCRVVSHPRDTDVNGNPSQFTYTVGGGNVSVFRHGKRINGTWSRPRTSSGTALRLHNGKPIPLVPGNTWVILIRNGVATLG